MKMNELYQKIKTYETYIDMVCKGYVHGIICQSKAGLGKTYTTIKYLKDNDVSYTYKSGVTTPVALYKLLYNNRCDIIVLDDIETLFNDYRMINMMKDALWSIGDTRTLSYDTSSYALQGYPSNFVFEGKIIILINELYGKNDNSFNAVMSRCLKYELKYSLEEIKELAKKIAFNRHDDKDGDLTEMQRDKVHELIDKIKPAHEFNFRMLERMIMFVKYSFKNAERLFFDSIHIDEEKRIMLDIIQNDSIVENQVIKFMEQTGQSRMTFFRKKKKIKQEGLL